ncbi:MAG: hypothetical protein ACKO85_20735 [Isosphaeraceae bacterium]
MPEPKSNQTWCRALFLGILLTAPAGLWAQSPKDTGKSQAKDAGKSVDTSKQAPAGKSAADATQKAAPAAKADDKKAPEAKLEAKEVELTESFRDSRVDDALSTDLIKELPAPRPTFSQNEERQVLTSAGGRGDANPRSISRFVEAKAADLTNRKAIEAILNGEANSNALVRPIEAATQALINASKAANAASNTPFMTTYSAALIKTMQPLLKAHLVTRVQALLALASTGSLDVNPLLIQVMSDDEQPWQMKLVAIRGVNNSIQAGRRPMAFNARTQLTVALCNLIREETDAPWFIKSEAAEVIGNIRIVSESVSGRKVEPAELMMSLLVNSDERPKVRLAAARALGLMEIPSQFRPFNNHLVAASLAQAVADTAKKVMASTPTDSSRGQQLIAILAERIPSAFNGEQGMTDSGLVRQAVVGQGSTEAKAAIDALFNAIKPVINAGSNYVKSRGDIVEGRRTDLQTTIAELEKAIAKNQAKDRTLIKGGESFDAEEPAAEEKPKEVAQDK